MAVELIGDSLTARGAEVTFVNVINDAQSITMVQKKRCAGNPRGDDGRCYRQKCCSKLALDLWPFWYREHWLLRCRLLAVSERLAKLARELAK